MKRTWIGKYGYLYDDEASDYSSFEINVELIDGTFKGTVFEEEFTGATGDLIQVKGFIDGDFISFIKTFPYGFWIDENGDYIFDKTALGHQVIYHGNFDQENGIWSGEWEIELSVKNINDENDEVEVMVGVWDMKAKIDER